MKKVRPSLLASLEILYVESENEIPLALLAWLPYCW